MTESTSSAKREMHSRPVPAGRGFWWTDNLWIQSQYLRPFQIAIEDVAEFDLNCWFSAAAQPTCRAVAEHCRRILSADLDYPIILAEDGGLMDGGHRLAKAWLDGRTHVAAVQFLQDPEPDWVEPTKPQARAPGAEVGTVPD